jgi:hypothetical protein
MQGLDAYVSDSLPTCFSEKTSTNLNGCFFKVTVGKFGAGNAHQ